MLFFFLLLSSIIIYSFLSSLQLTHITFFIAFSYCLNCSFWLYHGYHSLLFFFCYPFFLILFFSLPRGYHTFLSFFFCIFFFNCSFSSSSKLSWMNSFLFLPFSLELWFVNFDFLFTGDFTLFQLIFSFCWSIASFTFYFSSSWRRCCLIIVSAVSEISSKVELTPAGPFNEFGGATRKLLVFLQINI